ncbi:hypothetical protein HW555_000523 [Spodoptera exigua]|uniref:Uncharacterized protein n=1 Tax=Spodoptera exigua TaxID=7107 RepID=A0A835GSF5_SPOEX|nr:hypothetical protein HW555_000523 [Spodoptera exigua]
MYPNSVKTKQLSKLDTLFLYENRLIAYYMEHITKRKYILYRRKRDTSAHRGVRSRTGASLHNSVARRSNQGSYPTLGSRANSYSTLGNRVQQFLPEKPASKDLPCLLEQCENEEQRRGVQWEVRVQCELMARASAALTRINMAWRRTSTAWSLWRSCVLLCATPRTPTPWRCKCTTQISKPINWISPNDKFTFSCPQEQTRVLYKLKYKSYIKEESPDS